MKKKIESILPPQPFLLTNKPPKNRQSMTACSLLRLLLRRMLYVTTHVTKEHFCKILWSKLRQGEVYKIVEYRIEIGRVRSGPGARFSKVPRTFRARKAIRKITTCLFCKADLFTCCKGNKNKNNGKVSCLETPSFWRYKESYVTRNTPEKFRDFRETGSRIKMSHSFTHLLRSTE